MSANFTAESDRIITANCGRPRGFIEWKPRAASEQILERIYAVVMERRPPAADGPRGT